MIVYNNIQQLQQHMFWIIIGFFYTGTEISHFHVLLNVLLFLFSASHLVTDVKSSYEVYYNIRSYNNIQYNIVLTFSVYLVCAERKFIGLLCEKTVFVLAGVLLYIKQGKYEKRKKNTRRGREGTRERTKPTISTLVSIFFTE